MTALTAVGRTFITIFITMNNTISQVTIGGGGVPVLPYTASLVNLDISETRTTGWVTVATEEADYGHLEELVTGHR